MIKRNKIVFLDLLIFDAAGTVVESTEKKGAFCYLHGRGNLLPALEDALDNQQIGFETEITLEPQQAFGEFRPELVVDVPKSQLTDGVNAAQGECVQADGPNGIMTFEIEQVEDDQVRLNANHPLAGLSLTFVLKVLEVRTAHKDEVKHRRPHPGGHHLMVADSSWSVDMADRDIAR